MDTRNNRSAKQVIDDLCQDCGKCDTLTGQDYCIFKEILGMLIHDPRAFKQVKCMEIFKYERKIKGWDEAADVWLREGKAEKFAQSYDPNLTSRQIYFRMEGRKEQ